MKPPPQGVHLGRVLSAFAPSGGSGTLCSRKGVKRDEVPGMWIDGDQRAA